MNAYYKLSPKPREESATDQGDSAVRRGLVRYGILPDQPIYPYAVAPMGRGIVWRQGSLLVALREKDGEGLIFPSKEESDD